MAKDGQAKAKQQLQGYRKEINALDNQIVKLLGQRMKVVSKVGKLKSKHGIDSFLADRVQQVLDRVAMLGKKHKVDVGFLQNMYKTMIMNACLHEEEIMAKLKKSKKK